MAIDAHFKTEFDLVIKKYGPKRDESNYYPRSPHEEVETEVKEQLNFKSLSATEVMRKLIDYLSDR